MQIDLHYNSTPFPFTLSRLNIIFFNSSFQPPNHLIHFSMPAMLPSVPENEANFFLMSHQHQPLHV